MKKLSVKQQQGIILAVVVIIGFVVIGIIISGYLYNIDRSKNYENNPKYIISDTVRDDKGNFLSLKGNYKLLEFEFDSSTQYFAKYNVDDICYNSVVSQMRKMGASEEYNSLAVGFPSKLREQPELWFDSNGESEADYIFWMKGKRHQTLYSAAPYDYVAVVLYEENGHKILCVLQSVS